MFQEPYTDEKNTFMRHILNIFLCKNREKNLFEEAKLISEHLKK